jgi:hypothetical protein
MSQLPNDYGFRRGQRRLCGEGGSSTASWSARRGEAGARLAALSARRKPGRPFNLGGGGAHGGRARARSAGPEGVIAKRKDSPYQPGERSTDWLKLKLERQQEFVIGGYRPEGSNSFDALLIGYYDGRDLRFAGKVRAGRKPCQPRQSPEGPASKSRPTDPRRPWIPIQYPSRSHRRWHRSGDRSPTG